MYHDNLNFLALSIENIGKSYLYHRLECPWYKCYVPHCPYRLIVRQYKVENWIYYIDSHGNSIMGQNMQAVTTFLLMFLNKKMGKSY